MINRSAPSTCCCAPMASRWTAPATGLVIEASIFIASIVAMAAPALIFWPTSTASETTPANGAAT